MKIDSEQQLYSAQLEDGMIPKISAKHSKPVTMQPEIRRNDIHYAGFCESGIRSENEDYSQIVPNPKKGCYLFVVCDGMGGHAYGKLAAVAVCDAICEYWQQASFCDGVGKILKAAFKKASKVLDTKAGYQNHAEMGTTMVLAAIDGNQLTIAHAGDSRAYLIRPGAGIIYQTRDHVSHGIWGDSIDRCFFSYQQEKADVEIRQIDLQQGDRIFLCTDGVPTIIVPEIFTRRSMICQPPEDVIDMIQFFCEQFSKDNYTGILVYYE